MIIITIMIIIMITIIIIIIIVIIIITIIIVIFFIIILLQNRTNMKCEQHTLFYIESLQLVGTPWGRKWHFVYLH